MVLSVSGLRLSLTSAGLEAGEGADVDVVISADLYDLLQTQSGDFLFTQDERQILLNKTRYLTAQDGTFLTTESNDVLLLN